MKTSFLKILLLFFVASMLTSCEKVLDIDVDEGNRYVVVNALPCTDSVLFVNITYSRFFLDNRPFVPIDNASVTIDINGTPTSPTQRDGANYMFSHIVAANDTLTLHVAIPGHDEIVAGTRCVALPAMTTPLAEIDTLQPISQGNISFTLTDPADQENYYYIYVMEYDSGSQWNMWEEKWDTIDTVVNSYFTCFNHEVTGSDVNNSEGMMDYFTSLLFSDRNINGEVYDLLLSIPMFKDTAENPILRRYTLIVESLSKDAFRYITDANQAQGMTSYFAEPARLYCNLSSGLGIFASIARRTYELEFTYMVQPEDAKKQRRIKVSSFADEPSAIQF